MPRYFIEIAYRGTDYSGFQVQENARTVQSEVQKAFTILHRRSGSFTGSSRTDAGVHALQNYFHFDDEAGVHPAFVYKMNAILPRDIVVRSIREVPETAHSRFDARSREYHYHVHRFKDPFLEETSFFLPYRLELEPMFAATELIKGQIDFYAFAKTNSGAKSNTCRIYRCEWKVEGERMVFIIEANRFLRGMVRLITATLLKVGRGKMQVEDVERMFEKGEKAVYSVPAHGLFLKAVHFPENYFPAYDVAFTGF
jgi:tRNA pseudouridine38-40 synthase